MDKETEEREEIQNQNQEFSKAENDVLSTPQDEFEQINSAFKEEIEYEEIAGVESSPMNEAVKQGEVSEGKLEIEPPLIDDTIPQEVDADIPPELLEEFRNDSRPPTDAPEQEINASGEDSDGLDEGEREDDQQFIEPKFNSSVADHHAGIAADSLIGAADNLLETGGSFLVKIKKKKQYHDFDKWLGFDKEDPNSLNAKIEAFNDHNIKRVKLDEEDKMQLRPVLKEVLKRKATALTPEQQLLALGITILIKKGKAVIEMRNESKALQDHIDSIVKDYRQNVKSQAPEVVTETKEQVETKVEEDGEKGEDNTDKKAA